MTSRTRLTKLPMSGNALADWFFRQLVVFLRKDNLFIKRKRRLINPDDKHNRTIRGLMDPLVHPDYIHILINPARDANRNRDEEVDTLIHELSHIILEETAECDIVKLEGILAKNLSVAQRRYLKTFLPRHIIKKYPTRESVSRVATV